ncbi:MAG: DUF2520 domain-containing protein [Actinomycetaceae bacterium]|nr:DUF2520 domain-containing protein [Actinomycetaceae bacterium]
MQQRSGRLSIGVIGMGHVGPVIASALRSVGHEIIGVSASSPESRERADAMLPGVPITEVPALVNESELVILAVPDDQIGPLVSGLADLGAWKVGQLVAHLSGAHGIALLDPATRAGAIPLAIHPAMTFTGWSADVARLVGTPFAVTAPAPFLPIAHALVVELGGEPVDIAENDRVAYHAALTHGANHLATLVLQSLDTLRAAGVDEPGHFAAPLFSAALDRALREGDNAISGPIPRGDAGTVAEHIRALGDLAAGGEGADEILDTYAYMTRRTTMRLHAAGRLSDTAAEAILAALNTL